MKLHFIPVIDRPPHLIREFLMLNDRMNRYLSEARACALRSIIHTLPASKPEKTRRRAIGCYHEYERALAKITRFSLAHFGQSWPAVAKALAVRV